MSTVGHVFKLEVRVVDGLLKARDELSRGLRSPASEEHFARERSDKAAGSDELLIRLRQRGERRQFAGIAFASHQRRRVALSAGALVGNLSRLGLRGSEGSVLQIVFIRRV